MFVMAVAASALDVIVKTDGSSVEAKVLNISSTEVQFKKHSNLDGPTYTLPVNNIVSITYANGEVEYFAGSTGAGVIETTPGAANNGYIPVTNANSIDGSFGTTVSDYARGNFSNAYDADAVNRASNAGGNGLLKISLLWDDSNDLDLIVNEPNGTYIYFANKTNSRSGAQFGSDGFGGYGSSESATWTNPQTGVYDVFVRVRGTVPSGGEIVKVVIQAGNDTQCYTSRITKSGSDQKDVRVCSYNYTGPSSYASTSSSIPVTTYRSSETRDYWCGQAINAFMDAETSTAYDADAVNRANNAPGNGPLKFTLIWDFSNDCDLIANQANGTDIYFANQSDSTYGGRFHGDDVGGSGINVESITWSDPHSGGLYDAFVRVRGGAVNNGLVKLVVTKDGRSTVYSTRINKYGSDSVDIRLANIQY